jgi:fumarate reductase iron-sulfur subunit
MSNSQHATRTITLEVLRYNPETPEPMEPSFQRFEVPFTDDMSVLQGLQYIKDELDGSLSFRWSCRMAICGSCGMMLNGKPELACHTFLRDYFPEGVRIEPLRHFPIEKDLIVDSESFMRKMESVKPYIIPAEPRNIAQGEYLQTPAQLAQYEQFSDCINCTLCYAACPQVGINDDFLGPGVIALAHRYNQDNRDGGQHERMAVLGSEAGVWNCTAVGYCSEVCPKQVDPASAVNVNKIGSAREYFTRFFLPKGQGEH